MIEKAREKAEKETIRVEYYVQDMRNIKLKRKFDCAICMFGGFGYINIYDDLVNLLSGVKNHLNRDGLFIFEFLFSNSGISVD